MQQKLLSLVLVVTFLIVATLTFTPEKSFALLGPNLTLQLTDPGTFSTTYSPRRIAVEVSLTFSADSNIIGPIEASIPVTAASTKCRFTRFYWFQAGTLVGNTYTITFRNPVSSHDAYEQDAFDAMQLIYMTIGASSAAKIVSSSVCVFFEALAIAEIDSVARSFQAAETRCKSTPGNFLATILKAEDDATLVASLNTALGNYWIGHYAVDNRPADTLYCARDDPDFEEAGCVDGGYYAYFRVRNAGGNSNTGASTAGVQCIRPTGLTCSAYDMNWDCCAGQGHTWNMRLTWDGTRWLHWDRSENRTAAGHTMGHICANIAPYDRVPGDLCHAPTITLTQTTLTRTQSFSVTKTFTHSGTRTASLTKSSSLTKTFSVTNTKSASLTFSKSISKTVSITGTKSQSLTFSRTLTATATATNTRSKSVSFSHSLSTSGSLSSTGSVSESFTETPTLTRKTFSKSKTITESQSESTSMSTTLEATATNTSSRSNTESASKTFSHSASKSMTGSPSTTPTGKTPSGTRTKTITPVPSFTRALTLSRSSSITGGSRTPSFLFFETCSEGWIQFGKYCFQHFPIGYSASNANESLPTPMTFFDALNFCEREHGATIAPIQNAAMMDFIREQVVGANTGRKFRNGVYQDDRFTQLDQTWRTIFNRTGFNDFFHWDTRRRMPHFENCVAFHVRGNLGARIVGGNDAMITLPCNSRAEVVCARLRDPWSVTSVNQTDFGSLLAIEGHPLTLSVVGRRLPRNMGVQLQTTTYKTHAGAEGQPTHCRQTKPRNPVPVTNGSSTPAFQQNITRIFSFDRLCNGTCDRALFKFPPPEKLQLQRGFKYSFCFFLPYDYEQPLSSDEFRWDFLPNLYLEVAQSQINYQKETCERRNQLIDVLYYDQTATDSARVVPTPWYFDGPLQAPNYQFREGLA